MSARADKLKNLFLKRMEDKYNQEQYFIEGCFKNETKYSARIALLEASLSILFTENNYLISCGNKEPYATVESGKVHTALTGHKVGTIN